jgi:hypothetical protein
LCLVHLVRAANGLGPFEAFLAALRRHDPGVEHELVLAMKGFAGDEQARPYLERAGDLSPTALRFSDEGYDLGVYLGSALRLRRRRYCFVNSFSAPLAAGWLAALDRALSEPGVGLAGASGSWASPHSLALHTLRLPNAYRGVLPAPHEAIAAFMALDADARGADAPAPPGRLRSRIRTLVEMPERIAPTLPFPSFHVRTNAFAIDHDTLASLRLPRTIVDKRDAHLLENGRASITRQLVRRGLRTVVAGRDGAAYDRSGWAESLTFWQGDQQNLLVADNQTRAYESADDARRRLLSAYAWGREARPAPRPQRQEVPGA